MVVNSIRDVKMANSRVSVTNVRMANIVRYVGEANSVAILEQITA
jgi:hypothetical protein